MRNFKSVDLISYYRDHIYEKKSFRSNVMDFVHCLTLLGRILFGVIFLCILFMLLCVVFSGYAWTYYIEIIAYTLLIVSSIWLVFSKKIVSIEYRIKKRQSDGFDLLDRVEGIEIFLSQYVSLYISPSFLEFILKDINRLKSEYIDRIKTNKTIRAFKNISSGLISLLTGIFMDEFLGEILQGNLKNVILFGYFLIILKLMVCVTDIALDTFILFLERKGRYDNLISDLNYLLRDKIEFCALNDK